MIKKQGKPISGGAGQFRPTPPVLSNQATTSADAQRVVRQPPQPFQNAVGAAELPAPTNRNAAHPYGTPAKTLLPKKAGARMEQNVGSASAANTSRDMLAAVGEPRLPKGYNSIMSGRPTEGAARRVGNGSQPKGAASKRKGAPFYGQR